MKATAALEKADADLFDARERCAELEQKVGGMSVIVEKARATEVAYKKLLVATTEAAAATAAKLASPSRVAHPPNALLSPPAAGTGSGGSCEAGGSGVVSPPVFHPSPVKVSNPATAGGMTVSAIMKLDEAMTRIHELEADLERKQIEYNELYTAHTQLLLTAAANASANASATTATAPNSSTGLPLSLLAPASPDPKSAPAVKPVLSEPVEPALSKIDESSVLTVSIPDATAAIAAPTTNSGPPEPSPSAHALASSTAAGAAERDRIEKWEVKHSEMWEEKWLAKEKELEKEWRTDYERKINTKQAELDEEAARRAAKTEAELNRLFDAKLTEAVNKRRAEWALERPPASHVTPSRKGTSIAEMMREEAKSSAPAPSPAPIPVSLAPAANADDKKSAVPPSPVIIIDSSAVPAITPVPAGSGSGSGGAAYTEMKIISGFTFDEPSFQCSPHDQELLHKVFLMLGGQWLLAQSIVPSNPAAAIRSWTPDSDVAHCTLCRNKFTFFKRKHHCRLCGGVYCAVCSSHTQTLTKFKLVKVRVCNVCFVIVQAMELPESVGLTPAPTPRLAGSRAPAPSLVQQLTGGSNLAVSNGRLSLLSPLPEGGAFGGGASRFNSVRSSNNLSAAYPVSGINGSPTPSIISSSGASPAPLTLNASAKPPLAPGKPTGAVISNAAGSGGAANSSGVPPPIAIIRVPTGNADVKTGSSAPGAASVLGTSAPHQMYEYQATGHKASALPPSGTATPTSPHSPRHTSATPTPVLTGRTPHTPLPSPAYLPSPLTSALNHPSLTGANAPSGRGTPTTPFDDGH